MKTQTRPETLALSDSLANSSVSIKRVEAEDARRATDTLNVLRDRLHCHEHYYPGIRRWVADKVIPDLRTGKRTAYIGFHGEIPILAAVLKRGASTKFCHLCIENGFQDVKLGYLMFSLMAAEVRSVAKEVHFTLPESLWEREQGFFSAFGFESVGVASSQYRLFDEELRCSAPFSRVWSRVVSQLPTLLTSASIAGYWLNDGVVLSIHEEHAMAVMKGEKTVELRKRFADRWVGRNASVYCAGGSGSLLGTVTIEKVTKAKPGDLWDRYATCLCCSRDEFDAYVGNRPYAYAIELSNPRPYHNTLLLSQLSHLVGETLHPPQSYSTHTGFDVWGRALSLAAILQPSLAVRLSGWKQSDPRGPRLATAGRGQGQGMRASSARRPQKASAPELKRALSGKR